MCVHVWMCVHLFVMCMCMRVHVCVHVMHVRVRMCVHVEPPHWLLYQVLLLMIGQQQKQSGA